MAKLITRAFPPARLTINEYDGSKPDPFGASIDALTAQALFAQYRADMPSDSGTSDMLNSSVYYTVDLR